MNNLFGKQVMFAPFADGKLFIGFGDASEPSGGGDDVDGQMFADDAKTQGAFADDAKTQAAKTKD